MASVFVIILMDMNLDLMGKELYLIIWQDIPILITLILKWMFFGLNIQDRILSRY